MTFWATIKYITFFKKTGVVTFDNFWATLHSNIWSHCTLHMQKIYSRLKDTKIACTLCM